MAGREPGVEQLRGLIRSIPDFPRSGIVVRDVTPLFADRAAPAAAVELLAAPGAPPTSSSTAPPSSTSTSTRFRPAPASSSTTTYSLITFDE